MSFSREHDGGGADAPKRAAGGDIDATVISGMPPVGPLSMAEIGRALEGRRLGAYQLERFVGGGGMGAVFRALDTTLDRIVAVKVLSRQQSSDEEMLKRFRNEAQSAARLDHENIGRVHAVGTEDGWHFIVFEYIEGTNVRDLVRETGPFDVARTINVTIQVADALEHAAEREVVHRDIKPSNIIITPAGRARLVDMGLARLHHVEARDDLTASGMTLGTFDYISPEQARDPRSADVRSDLYSLGCTIYFMLAGRPPFGDGTMVQKLLLHQQEPPPDIAVVRPDAPRRLAAVISRLMAKDPADRHQRPAELIADLLAVAEDEGIDVSASRSPTVDGVEPAGPPARLPGSRLPWLVPVVGLLALVAGLWWMSRAGQSNVKISRPADAESSEPREATVDGRDSRLPWRVVDVPDGDRETGTLADALRLAADGDTIELSYDGIRDEPPLVVEGLNLTIRGSAGRSPGVRFLSPPDGGAGGRSPVAWTVTSGTLTVDRARLIMVVGDFTTASALFAVGRGAMLACEDCMLEVRCSDEPMQADVGAEATVVLAGGDPQDDGSRADVRISRTVVWGHGGFLRVGGDRRAAVTWSEGRCVLGAAFLVAEGGARADGPGPAVNLSMTDATFACRGGFARLLDSPARPGLPDMRAFADGCRFVVPEGVALLTQTGIEEPDRYRGVVEWLDAASRYEGSGVFRRIDGAAERMDTDYDSAPQPLVHVATIDDDVAAWWSGGPDS